MKNGLYELRVKAGSDISRIFYFFFSNGVPSGKCGFTTLRNFS
jgi:hypothetical protein